MSDFQKKKNSKPAPVPPATPSRPPMQSQLDEERGDWEGMGQGRYQPDAESDKPPSKVKVRESP